MREIDENIKNKIIDICNSIQNKSDYISEEIKNCYEIEIIASITSSLDIPTIKFIKKYYTDFK